MRWVVFNEHFYSSRWGCTCVSVSHMIAFMFLGPLSLMKCCVLGSSSMRVPRLTRFHHNSYDSNGNIWAQHEGNLYLEQCSLYWTVSPKAPWGTAWGHSHHLPQFCPPDHVSPLDKTIYLTPEWCSNAPGRMSEFHLCIAHFSQLVLMAMAIEIFIWLNFHF